MDIFQILLQVNNPLSCYYKYFHVHNSGTDLSEPVMFKNVR